MILANAGNLLDDNVWILKSEAHRTMPITSGVS